MKKIIMALGALMVAAAFSAAAQTRTVWEDGRKFPLYGKATEHTAAAYTRLPDSLKEISRQPVWDLGLNSAGLAIRFRSDAKTISVKWGRSFESRLNHMSPTGVGGLDLYTLCDGTWRFVNSARPVGRDNEQVVIDHMTGEEREYMLYLSLYDGVDYIRIGVEEGARLEQPAQALPRREKPMVFYGTSILQGGCCSRPGMAHTNIISRRLNREAINLGFSGNGRLDYEIAHLMAEVDAGVFVMDCVPNCSKEEIREKMIPFFEILRGKHPSTPVIFVEDPVFTHAKFDQRMAAEIEGCNKALHEVFDQLRKRGEKHIRLVSSRDMLGHDGEATVDGIHFTDLGMMRYADLMTPVIRKCLK